MRRVVIAGASLAGVRAAEALRAKGYDGEITFVGEEAAEPYDRPPLSKGLLGGAVQPGEIALRRSPALAAEWRLGVRAAGLDMERREIQLSTGDAVGFDGLVIATGARPRTLPTVPLDVEGVFSLRTLDDALALRAALAGRPRVVVVGAGFIGTEIASTCRELGLDVSVVTLEAPLAQALGSMSKVALELLADHSVEIAVGRGVAGIEGRDRVEEVVLDDGRRIPADVVVVAVGVAPATGWLEGSGLRIEDGVACDAGCAAAPGVVAAGDVARWPNTRFGGRSMRVEHWTNAAEQGFAAARTLLGGDAEYRPVPSFWSDQFGLRIQAIGVPAMADSVQVVDGSIADRRFVATMTRDGALVAALAFDDARGLARYRAKLANGPAK